MLKIIVMSFLLSPSTLIEGPYVNHLNDGDKATAWTASFVKELNIVEGMETCVGDTMPPKWSVWEGILKNSSVKSQCASKIKLDASKKWHDNVTRAR